MSSEEKLDITLNPDANPGMYRGDVSTAHRIIAIFGDDPEIETNLEYGDEISTLTITVNNSKKAAAISKLLPKKYEFANIQLIVKVEDSSDTEVTPDVIKDALEGNPHFKELKEVVIPIIEAKAYVCIFNKEVIQFLNDNASSLHGFEFRIAEDIAREVFKGSQIFYTTDDGTED